MSLNKELLAEGLRKLRMGALLYLIAVVLLIVSLALLMPVMYSLITPSILQPPPVVVLAVLTPALVMLVALVLDIAALILWFMSTGRFKRFNARFGIGRTGMILQLAAVVVGIGTLVFMAPALTSPSAAPPPVGFAGLVAAIILLLMTFILALVGSILFGVMLRRLPEAEGVEPGFKTAGLLYIVGTVLAIIPYVNLIAAILMLISVILIYRYSGASLARVS